MPKFTNISITGNVGRDAELRHSPKGTPYATLSVAVSTGTKAEPSAEWFEVVCFDGVAQSVAHCRKGTRVRAEGLFRTNIGKDGKKYLKVLVDDEGGSVTPLNTDWAMPKPAPPKATKPAPPIAVADDDDIPF